MHKTVIVGAGILRTKPAPVAASPDGDTWIMFGEAVTSAVEVAAIQRLRWIGAALASQEEGSQLAP